MADGACDQAAPVHHDLDTTWAFFGAECASHAGALPSGAPAISSGCRAADTVASQCLSGPDGTKLGVCGTVGAIVSLATGYLATWSMGHDAPGHDVIHIHRNWMIATTILAVALFGFLLLHQPPLPDTHAGGGHRARTCRGYTHAGSGSRRAASLRIRDRNCDAASLRLLRRGRAFARGARALERR